MINSRDKSQSQKESKIRTIEKVQIWKEKGNTSYYAHLIQFLLPVPERRFCLNEFLIPFFVHVRGQISISQAKCPKSSSPKLLQVFPSSFLQIKVSVKQPLINYIICTLRKVGSMIIFLLK